MYAIDWVFLLTRKDAGKATQPDAATATARSSARPLVSSTVWALGLTSLLTDVSSEMVASILPVYLVLHLGLSPLAFGVIDGIYQGAAALLRILAGVLSDKWQRHKQIAATGYALSTACRLLILAAGSAWSTVAAVVALDRLGKGIRTAPRDAMIAQSTPPEALATAFGVHRSLDAVGAMLGPVVAFALLALIPGGFDVLFVASFGIALLGVFAIVLLIPPMSGARVTTSISWRSTAALLVDRRFAALVVSALVLGIATISDSFVYLMLQRRLGFGATAFPLLYVCTSLITSMFAVPCGRLADRVGRRHIMLAGYVGLACAYGVLLGWGHGVGSAALVVALLGAYYAATEGVFAAMAAAVLPESHRGSGLAVLATATNLARLVASVAFGWLWTVTGLQTATWIALIALIVATAFAGYALSRAENSDR